MGKMKFFLKEKLMKYFFSFNKYLSIKIIFYIFLPIFLIFLYLNYNNIKINYSNKFDTFKVLDFLDLKLKYINIKGLNNINKEDIIEQLKLKKTNSILFINLDNLKKQIKKFNLIETVHIERVLPNTLNIKLTEKTPIGIMQENNIYKLITKDGSILTTNNLQKFNQLPIFIGKEVEKSAKDILNLLTKVNFKEEIWSISLINERRWNLNLKKGVTILLPEKNIVKALNLINDIEESYKILDGNFLEIDLRNDKQIIFKPLLE